MVSASSIKRMLADLGLYGRMVYKGKAKMGGVEADIYLSTDKDWEKYANRKLQAAKRSAKKHVTTRAPKRGKHRDDKTSRGTT